jgi:TolB protein
MTIMRRPVSLLALMTLAPLALGAQWKHRYPKLVGSNHHVYVEGYELPVLNAGASDPAESPDGKALAVASRGWIWLVDRETGEARRLTRGGRMDSRPAWSPDGRSLAFVRDDGNTLAVIVRDVAGGNEREIERGFAMDPAFSPDGRTLYYSSSTAGGLDIWRVDLGSGEKTRITTDPGMELAAQPHPDGKRLVYIVKAGGADQVRVRTLADGKETVLVTGPILAQMRMSLSRDGSVVAYNAPGVRGWELRLVGVERPGPTVLLVARDNGLPLAPSWSADGRTVYFMEADRDQQLKLYSIAKVGGQVAEISIRRWHWGEETGRVIVRTRVRGRAEPAPARLNVVDGQGHPVVPDRGQPRSDGQNGLVFFYSPGVIALEAPAGQVAVSAVQGLATPAVTTQVQVAPGQTREVELEMAPVWDARAAGWYSGDHHFHLNFGGQFPLVPEDLLPLIRGEDLDVATPLIGNLANRFEHADYWTWRKLDALPLVRFGQEVRPSLGHTGLIGTETLFWPWTFGSGTQVYPRDDISNADPLAHARREGGIATYMHPVQTVGDPFVSDETLGAIPTQLVADGVQGALDALEVACVWSDEIATAEVWHRLLSLGVPVALNAGTDVMADFYRTPALGTTRIYVRVAGPVNFGSYLAALKAGRSFVTNGPLLDFRVDGAQPGDVLTRGGRSVPFTLDVHSAVPVDSVAILVNGVVAWHGKGVTAAGSTRLTGTVRVPAGGWVAAVALGGATTRWPAMDSYAYAHTSPVWIARVGSTDAVAARAAARDLLRALAVAERRIATSYAGADVPKLRAHFTSARALLETRAAH